MDADHPDDSDNVDKGPNDELKELGDTFDAMLDRLDAAFDAQRRRSFFKSAEQRFRSDQIEVLSQ